MITFPQPPFSHRDLCRLLVDEAVWVRYPSAGKGILLTGRLSRDFILGGEQRGHPRPRDVAESHPGAPAPPSRPPERSRGDPRSFCVRSRSFPTPVPPRRGCCPGEQVQAAYVLTCGWACVSGRGCAASHPQSSPLQSHLSLLMPERGPSPTPAWPRSRCLRPQSSVHRENTASS